MGSVYGLRYDYVQQNGSFLIVTKQEGLYSRDLIDLQVKMLQSNPIPRLLPIEIEEMDSEVKLRYNITGKRILNHFLIGKKLTQKELFQLLLKITSILDDSKNFMLSENNYLLHEDFIFIGQDLGDLYLTYVPLKTLPQKNSVTSDVRTLAMSLIANVDELTGHAFQELMNYLKGGTTSLEGVKQLLIKINNDLLTGKPQESRQPHSFSNEEKFPHQEQHIKPMRFNEQGYSHVEQPKRNEYVNPNMELFHETLESVEEVVELPIAPLPQKVKSYISVFALLGLFVTWKSYLDFQSQGMLYIASGISLLILDAMFFCMNQLWKKPETQVVTKQTPVKATSDYRVEPRIEPYDDIFKGNPHSFQEEAPRPSAYQSSQANVKNYYDQLQFETTILQQPGGHDQTVLIGKAPANQHAAIPYLELNRNGAIKKVEISQDSFIIGRNITVAQYVEDNKAVGRAHLEIIKNSSGFAIRDLSSANGSYLNGERLIPNKLYPIKDRDVIRLASVEYTFFRG